MTKLALPTLQMLLISDHLASVETFNSIGKQHNLEIETVRTISECLELIQEKDPVAILLDLELIQCKHLRALTQLRNEMKGLKNIPIVVLVSAANEHLGRQALQSQAEDYLLKSELEAKYVDHVLRRAIERQELTLQMRYTAFQELETNLNSISAAEEIPKEKQAEQTYQQVVTNGKSTSIKTEEILSSIRLPFFSLDADWCFTYLNSAAKQILCNSQGEIIGTNIWSEFSNFFNSTFEKEFRWAQQQSCCVEFEEYSPELKVWFNIRVWPCGEGVSVLLEDISQRIVAQTTIVERDKYFTALVDLQLCLLRCPTPQVAYNEVLNCLGNTSQASRVYIFENYYNADGQLCMSQKAEWCALGIESHLNNPQFQNYPYQKGLSRWEEILSKGGVLAGNVCDFPKSEQQFLKPLKAQSILMLPLVVDNTFFGYIGFDNCHYPQPWQTYEIDLLRAAAAALSLSQKRIQTSIALAESETQYRSVVDNAGEIIFQADTKGKLTFLNRAWTEITGLEVSETIGYYLVDFMAAIDKFEILKCLESLTAQKASSCCFEARYFHKEGKLRWLKAKIRSLRDRDDKIIGITGTLDDITEQKLATQSLEREHQHHQQIINNAPIAMAMFDNEMRFLAHSQQWYTDYNVSNSKSLLGRCLYDILPDLPETWKRCHQEALAGKPFVRPECLLEREDGTKLYLRRSLHPWRTPTGEIGGIIIATQKINELVEAREAALEAAQIQTNFLTTMSHELRTPLNGILGMAELLLETNLSFQQHDFLRTLHFSANNLLSLINNILDFSKLEAQEIQLDLQKFNLHNCVEEIVELLAIQTVAKNNDLFLFIDSDVPLSIIGDSFRLRQVLINLLGNAIKFTEAGEVRIRISVEKMANTNLEVQPPITLRFEVQDTGIGISLENQNKLFQAFSQTDASIARHYGGNGLGLMICKQIVELLGGQIGVESQVGAGSTFWFTAKFSAAENTASLAVPQSLAYRKLLIIDSNETYRDFAYSYTQDWGLQAERTANLDEAIILCEEAYLRGEPYDLGLLSLSVSEIETNRFGKVLKNYPFLRQTQWIIAIAITQHPQIPLLLKQGAADYLLKPLKPTQLLETLSRVIEPESATMPTATSSLRILVADDTAINQKVVLNQLSLLGHTADCVGDGQEALEKLEQNDYDLVLLDCSMPIVNGYEVSQRLREKGGRNHQTVVIALTAYTLSEIREKCLAVGMNDYLSKPTTMENLKAKIQSWFPFPTHSSSIPKADLAPIDIKQLQEFCGEDVDFQYMLIETFLEEAPKYLTNIQNALAQGNFEEVEVMAHRLRGAAVIAAVQKIAEIAKQLEFQANQGYLKFDETGFSISQMYKILGEVKVFINDFVSNSLPN